MASLRDVLFVGNPMYEGLSKEETRLEVLRVCDEFRFFLTFVLLQRIPQVMKIDGDVVTNSERQEVFGDSGSLYGDEETKGEEEEEG